jgi:hypothetical protein
MLLLLAPPKSKLSIDDAYFPEVDCLVVLLIPAAADYLSPWPLLLMFLLVSLVTISY